jgi:hypothetical protein
LEILATIGVFVGSEEIPGYPRGSPAASFNTFVESLFDKRATANGGELDVAGGGPFKTKSPRCFNVETQEGGRWVLHVFCLVLVFCLAASGVLSMRHRKSASQSVKWTLENLDKIL